MARRRKKKKRKKLDFESYHESTEKKFQSEIKIKSTTIDSDLGDIDVQSIGLEEASSESQKHNSSSKRPKCEPYEADSEDKKRRCAARNNKRIYKCSSKVFQSRRLHHLALASNSKRCRKSIHTDGKANSKVEEYKEENPIEIEQEAEAAGVSELKWRSKDYECGVCFKVLHLDKLWVVTRGHIIMLGALKLYRRRKRKEPHMYRGSILMFWTFLILISILLLKKVVGSRLGALDFRGG